MSDQPDWYDETQIVKATFADGYSGWVQDLGDGTCRFTNAPLLGETGPEWGDRVDLFYNPCAPFERPRVGFRVYPEGVEPTGRNFGKQRKPTKAEKKEQKRLEKIYEKDQCDRISANFDSMFGRLGSWKAQSQSARRLIQYHELRTFCLESGLEIPDDLHKPTPFDKIDDLGEEKTVECRRKELKTMLLAVIESYFADVEVDNLSVNELVKGYTDDSKTAELLREKLQKELDSMDPAKLEEDLERFRREQEKEEV